MKQADAISLAERLAAEHAVQLGERVWTRAAGADQNSSCWAFLYKGENCSIGWLWIINVNELNRTPFIVAHNPSWPSAA
jgi:hypothetical protein